MATTPQNEFLTCQHCGNEMTYAAEDHGMTSQCPHCNQPVVLAGAPRTVEIQHRSVSTPKPSIWMREFWPSVPSRAVGLGLLTAMVLLALIIGALCGFEPASTIVRAWFPDAWFPEGTAR